MELLLLGLIGFGAFSYFMDEDDESSPTTARRGSASSGDNATPPPPQAPVTGRTFELESGVANPAGTSGNDTFTGIAEGDVLGGAGNDRFDFENGYGAEVFGGAGNDTLGPAGDAFTLHGDAGNDLFAFDTDVFDGAAAYGGTGDDRFELEISDSDTEKGPILSGGSGSDSYDLTFAEGDAERAGSSKFVTITDFAIDEDSLRVTFPELTNAELVQDPQGNFTDLRLNYQAEGSGGPIDRYMTIRLEGITGVSLEDFGIAPVSDGGGNSRSEGPDRILVREAGSIAAGGGDDTIRAADGFETEAMDGLFVDAGDGNDVIDIERLIGVHGVFGGAGDDRIIGRAGTSSTFRGGDGNDTIIGGGSHVLFGDGGDDVLQVPASDTMQGVRVEGGDGNDRIIADVNLGRESTSRTPSVMGGDGSDVFELKVGGVVDPAMASPDDRLTYEGLRIEDFDATQDRLVLDLTALSEDEPTVDILEITSTGVAIVFSNGARGFITCATEGLRPDDIEILTRAAAA